MLSMHVVIIMTIDEEKKDGKWALIYVLILILKGINMQRRKSFQTQTAGHTEEPLSTNKQKAVPWLGKEVESVTWQ